MNFDGIGLRERQPKEKENECRVFQHTAGAKSSHWLSAKSIQEFASWRNIAIALATRSERYRLFGSTALKVSTSVALSIQPSNNGKLARVPRFVTDDQSHKLGNAHSTRAWAIQIHLAQPLNLFS